MPNLLIYLVGKLLIYDHFLRGAFPTKGHRAKCQSLGRHYRRAAVGVSVGLVERINRVMISTSARATRPTPSPPSSLLMSRSGRICVGWE